MYGARNATMFASAPICQNACRGPVSHVVPMQKHSHIPSGSCPRTIWGLAHQFICGRLFSLRIVGNRSNPLPPHGMVWSASLPPPIESKMIFVFVGHVDWNGRASLIGCSASCRLVVAFRVPYKLKGGSAFYRSVSTLRLDPNHSHIGEE
jgi:hypothetical protein